MDNSLSKINHINHLAKKSFEDKNIDLLQNQNTKDLESCSKSI